MDRLCTNKSPERRSRRCWLVGLATAVLASAASGQAIMDPEWVSKHPGGSWGSETPSHVRAIHVGQDGTVYATGRHNDSRINLLVVAYAPDGTQLWDFVWSSNSASFDIGDSITADADGNLYVSVESREGMHVVSLTPGGQYRWHYTWEGEGLWCCFAADITTGPDGHVYVTGGYQAPGMPNSQSRVGTLSLTSEGVLRWQREWVTPMQDGTGVGWRIVADGSGDLYIAGRSSNHFLVLSYTADGDERWSYAVQQGNSAGNEAMGLVIGDDGNIYAAGRLDGASSRALYVVSLTAQGAFRWDYLYAGTAGLADRANALVWGADGNLYAGGKVVENDPETFEAMFIVSLTPEGQERWRHYELFGVYGSAPLAVRTVRGLASDAAGNIYAAGYNHVNGDVRFAIASVSPAGDPRWVYVGEAGMAEHLVTNGDRVYAVGIMNATGQFSDNRLGVAAFEADPGVEPCAADLNDDGVVDADDFFLFLQLFADGDLRADINGDFVIDADDFFAYLTLFAQGC